MGAWIGVFLPQARQRFLRMGKPEDLEPVNCKRCKSCSAGDGFSQAAGGVALENGVCTAYCSKTGYCGTSAAYRDGGTECSRCPSRA